MVARNRKIPGGLQSTGEKSNGRTRQQRGLSLDDVDISVEVRFCDESVYMTIAFTSRRVKTKGTIDQFARTILRSTIILCTRVGIKRVMEKLRSTR